MKTGRPLWAHAAAAAARLKRARGVLLALDFDGTLAPLVDHADRARLSDAARGELKRLKRVAALAVVSGRALADVRRRVRLAGIVYGGNHGVELAGCGQDYLHPAARSLKKHAGRLCRRARRIFRDVPGAFVEGKGFGVSVHYRRVPAGARAAFDRNVADFKKQSHALAFRWTRGHDVWDLRPSTGWNKGLALTRLWRRMGKPFVVCLGDDATDEDMFRAARSKGFGVKVGTGATRATYRLASQKEVVPFLRWVSTVLQEDPPR